MNKTIVAHLISFYSGVNIPQRKETRRPPPVFLGGAKPNPNYSENRMDNLPFLVEVFARLRDSITPAKSKEELEKCIHGVMSLISHEIRQIEEEDNKDSVPLSTGEPKDVNDEGWLAEHGQ